MEEEIEDPPMHGLEGKGLKKGSVSILGAVTIGLAATAPAYSLTGALGQGAAHVGYQLPALFLISVIPMYFVALAYKHLSDAAPDAGTVFTWGTKAIRPHVGWIGGYALAMSSIIASVGAAGIIVNAVMVLFGVESPSWALSMAIAAVFILATTWMVARGAEESSRMTMILTAIQYGGLVLFAGLMLVAVIRGNRNQTAEPFSWSWFNPFEIASPAAFLAAFLVAIFIFWGFDASLSMAEETQGTPEQSSRSGVIAILITVLTYVLFSIAALAFAGVDPDDPKSLTYDANIEDVFSTMAREAIGSRGAAIAAIVVGISALSATLSTAMSTVRGVLSMAAYKALPDRFATVDAVRQTPRFTTWFIGFTTLAVFVGLSFVSERIVADTVYSVAIAIITYYSIVAISSIAYFWGTAWDSWRTALGQVILPAIAVLILIPAGLIEAHHMLDPEYGSGGSVAGVGAVFIIGVLSMVLGVVLMVLWNLKAPEFFRGETLTHERSRRPEPVADAAEVEPPG